MKRTHLYIGDCDNWPVDASQPSLIESHAKQRERESVNAANSKPISGDIVVEGAPVPARVAPGVEVLLRSNIESKWGNPFKVPKISSLPSALFQPAQAKAEQTKKAMPQIKRIKQGNPT